MPKVLSLAWETILEIKHAFEDKHFQPEDILELFRRLHNDVQNIHEFPVDYQPIREKTCAELLAEERAANINTQPFQYSVVHQPPQEEISVEFLQDKRKQINSMQTFLRKFNRISFYEMPKVLSLAWETILEIEHALEDKHCQPEDILELFRRLHNDVQNIYEELAVYINTPSWDRPTICYNDDDDEDCTIAITPILSTEEPDNSLNQFEDFSNSNDDSTSIDDDSFSIDDIEYVEASPPDSELISSEVMEIVIPEEISTFDNSLPESETFCFDSKETSSGSTTTRADISLPDYEAFYDNHDKEISSGSTTTHSDFSLYDSFIFDLSINPFPPADRSDFYEFADELAHIISPPEYDCFSFKKEPNSGDFTMDVVEDIFLTKEPRVHVHNVLPTQPTLQLNMDFILSSESLFAYVVWIFLPFLLYPAGPQYLLSFENEDTIFDPDISNYHFSSFMTGCISS
uniref:Reverse transcriptase domain-containing protein n=1 Tax=Tanacetum cinerariifolium TaxID=118510 RepID=A0A6L2LAG8_TANCI|nr:hypothetical protein [Tanacetum cinerariifolium]